MMLEFGLSFYLTTRARTRIFGLGFKYTTGILRTASNAYILLICYCQS
jgi:hypothetical protein